MVRKLMKNESGFSLIELLITVVIIGVLAAMGVPQYRRMVSKSRQAEAKVMLGAIFTAENAFQSEYGTFSNNIGFMGVTIQAPQAYAAGFLAAADCTALAALFPTAANLPQAGAAYGTYGFGVGRLRTICTGSSAVTPTAAGFTATAVGNVQDTSAAGLATCGPGVCDVWSMTNAGLMTNVVAGY